MGTTDNKSKCNDDKCHKLVNNGSTSTDFESSTSCSPTSTSVPALPIFIDQDVIAGAKLVIQQIRPNWNLELVDFKVRKKLKTFSP